MCPRLKLARFADAPIDLVSTLFAPVLGKCWSKVLMCVVMWQMVVSLKFQGVHGSWLCVYVYFEFSKTIPSLCVMLSVTL